MLRTNIDGEDYTIKFRYADYEPKENRNGELCYVEPATTVCTIWANKQHVSGGVAYHNPEDRWDKAIGMRYAFQRAVSGLPRNIRTKLWYAFLHRKQSKAAA